jgi:hypothetical protein
VLAVGALHGHDGERLAVREVERHPRTAAAEPHRDDLRPLDVGDDEQVAHPQAALAGDRLEQCEPRQEPRDRGPDGDDAEPVVPLERDRPGPRQEHRDDGEQRELGRRDGQRRGPRAPRPERRVELRPRGRHPAQIRHAWMLVTRIARAPRS